MPAPEFPLVLGMDSNSGLHFPYCAVSSTTSSLWTLELLMWKGHLTSEFKGHSGYLSSVSMVGPSIGGQTGKENRQARVENCQLANKSITLWLLNWRRFFSQNSDNHE